MEVVIFCLILWCAFGGLGWYIAEQKGRSGAEGVFLGFLFGPLGCLIEALLPTADRTHSRPSSSRSGDGARVSSAPEDDAVLGFLNEAGGRSSHQVDLDATARAANQPKR